MEQKERTKHLSRTHNSLKAIENITQGWVAHIPERLSDDARIEKRAKRGLVARSRAQANDPEVLEQDTQLSGRDLVFLFPKVEDEKSAVYSK